MQTESLTEGMKNAKKRREKERNFWRYKKFSAKYKIEVWKSGKVYQREAESLGKAISTERMNVPAFSWTTEVWLAQKEGMYQHVAESLRCN